MTKWTKIFYMHDLDAFTGTDLGDSSATAVSYTKTDTTTVTCADRGNLIQENHAAYLGMGSDEAKRAFPLKTFASLDEAKTAFGPLTLHADVSSLVTNLDYALVGNTGLKVTYNFSNDSDLTSFNTIVAGGSNNSHTHGWSNYPWNSYYDSSYDGSSGHVGE